MAIDASIYNNIQQPAPVTAPSPIDMAQKAITLSTLGMQQMQMARQLRNQSAMQDAFSQNMDANGNIDYQGAINQLGKTSPQAALDLQDQVSKADKAKADAETAKAAAIHQMVTVTHPAAGYLLSLPDDQASQVYHGVVQHLASQGVPVQGFPPEWDRAKIQQGYDIGSQMKEQLDNQATQAQTAETQAKTAVIPSEIEKNQAAAAKDRADAGAPAPQKIAAEELGKFNEDVNNASSRKTTGSLIETRTRADRILSLLNSGAQPGETQAQRIARLNKYMPQIGTEVSTSLASIMQGGVPGEELQKKLSPDTLGSNLASLEQKVKASPSAANQGALLDAYGDVASKLRDFSADQLGQITSKARAAYPFANKYYSKEMDQIGSQIAAPVNASKAQPSDSDTAQTQASGSKGQAAPDAHDAKALAWLKTADASSPDAFAVRAKLKKKGLL